jgi:hypothetical protein
VANRPVFENRPLTDLAGLQSAVRRYVQGLERYLDEALADILAVVEEDDAGVSTEGSIFSMVGPGGADDPVVAYDFTRYDSSLSDAANLAAANLSGNSNLDFNTIVGAAKIDYLSRSNNTGQTPFAWTPFASRVDGGGLFTGLQTDYVGTNSTPAEIRFTGAMTAEWLGCITEQPSGAGDLFLFDFGGGGVTSAGNYLFGLKWVSATGTWTYFHDHGARVADTAAFFINPVAQLADTLFQPMHLALTRSAAGSVRLYINGRRAANAQTPSTTALPTDGSSSNLSIGFGHPTSKHAILGFRLFGVELTAAQVRESHRRTFFGVHA